MSPIQEAALTACTSCLMWCFKKPRSSIELYLFRWILKMMTFILTVASGKPMPCGITGKNSATFRKRDSEMPRCVPAPRVDFLDCLMWSLLRPGSARAALSPGKELYSLNLDSWASEILCRLNCFQSYCSKKSTCPRSLGHLRKRRARKRNQPVKSQVARRKHLEEMARRRKTEERQG